MRLLFVGLSALAAVSCGRTQSPQDAELDFLPTSNKYDSIDWYFPCPFDAPDEPNRLVVPPQGSSRNVILNGAGPFEFIKEEMAHLPVKVHGRVCPWKSMHREVTFVIDVSGSMKQNDPKDDSAERTCGRLKALNVLIDKMPPDITKFGVVTYDAAIKYYSSKLFAKKSDLFADLLRSDSSKIISDIVCEADGGTVYRQGILKAKQLFENGEGDATKELIFLSDGEPSDGYQAKQLATELKTKGVVSGGRRHNVSIATIFLGKAAPDPNVLLEMASVDASQIPPKPIYAEASHADQLADLLGRMIDNIRLQGSILTYSGDANNSVRETINVFTKIDARSQFVSPAFQLNLDRAQKNFILNFEYWDSIQNRSTYTGTLHWRK